MSEKKRLVFIAPGRNVRAPIPILETELISACAQRVSRVACVTATQYRMSGSNIDEIVVSRPWFWSRHFTRFGIAWVDWRERCSWARIASKRVGQSLRDSDENVYFVSVGSARPEALLLLDFLLARKMASFWLHFYDPPVDPRNFSAKVVWPKCYFSLCKSLIRRADVTSAVSGPMLEHVASWAGRRLESDDQVFLNNVQDVRLSLDSVFQREYSVVRMLIVGSLGSSRPIRSIVDAANALAGKGIKLYVRLVGRLQWEMKNWRSHAFAGVSVEWVDWSDDLDPHYAWANILVDVGSKDEGDVYISSKLSRYLSYNIPILCVCERGSATHQLLGDMSYGLRTVPHEKKAIESAILDLRAQGDQEAIAQARKVLRATASVGSHADKISQWVSSTAAT